MKPSTPDEVRRMYDDSAESYAEIMDREITLPIYANVLKRLSDGIADLNGPLIDTSCGSGHMLEMFNQQYDNRRELIGIDLSPQMVGIARKKLGNKAHVLDGDMCELTGVDSDSAAGVISFFAIHHLDQTGVSKALRDWHRVLQPGGRLLIAAWEGAGRIDYGDFSDVVAFRYESDELVLWIESVGFTIDRCVTEPVEEIPMDAIYLEATRT